MLPLKLLWQVFDNTFKMLILLVDILLVVVSNLPVNECKLTNYKLNRELYIYKQQSDILYVQITENCPGLKVNYPHLIPDDLVRQKLNYDRLLAMLTQCQIEKEKQKLAGSTAEELNTNGKGTSTSETTIHATAEMVNATTPENTKTKTAMTKVGSRETTTTVVKHQTTDRTADSVKTTMADVVHHATAKAMTTSGAKRPTTWNAGAFDVHTTTVNESSNEIETTNASVEHRPADKVTAGNVVITTTNAMHATTVKVQSESITAVTPVATTTSPMQAWQSATSLTESWRTMEGDGIKPGDSPSDACDLNKNLKWFRFTGEAGKLIIAVSTKILTGRFCVSRKIPLELRFQF